MFELLKPNERYSIGGHIKRGDSTVLDIAVEAIDTPESIRKAMNTVRRAMTNYLCMDILSISDAEFGKAEEIVRRQREYIHPFRMATVKRLNELGEFNTKVISAMRDLRELIKSGESI